MRNNIFRLRPRVFECFLLGGLFVIDQIAKAAFLLQEDRYIRNTGGPWGSDIPGAFFLVFVPLILLGIMFWWTKERNMSMRLPLVFLLAGGIGNLADRILLGYVRDFQVMTWFPAFNPADVFLTIGAAWLLLFLAIKKER